MKTNLHTTQHILYIIYTVSVYHYLLLCQTVTLAMGQGLVVEELVPIPAPLRTLQSNLCKHTVGVCLKSVWSQWFC